MSQNRLFRGNPFLEVGRRGSRRVVQSMAGSKPALILVTMSCIPIGFIALFQMLLGLDSGYGSSLMVLTVMQASAFLLVPPLFYNCVAGERERGSWELLRVAPVSTRQVLIGKFAAGLKLLLPWLLFGLVCMLLGLTNLREQSSWQVSPNVTVETIMVGVLLLLLGLFSTSALAIFLSCRMTKPFSALMATYGSLAVIYLVIPGVLALSGGDGAFVAEVLTDLNPVVLYSKLVLPNGMETAMFGLLVCSVFHLVLSIGLLLWAAFTLDFADRNLRFLPNKKES